MQPLANKNVPYFLFMLSLASAAIGHYNAATLLLGLTLIYYAYTELVTN